jgi:hypothetical protein
MQCFLYSLYDVNHDGYITRAEMLAVTSAIYDLLGDRSNAAQQCPQSHVNMIFKVHRLVFFCNTYYKFKYVAIISRKFYITTKTFNVVIPRQFKKVTDWWLQCSPPYTMIQAWQQVGNNGRATTEQAI